MKKAISVLISILIIIGTISIGIVSMAKDSDSSSDSITEKSIQEVSEMISEYDSENNYVSYSEYCEENQADVSIEDYEEEYQFQTARLIVRTESELELLNCVDYLMYDNSTYIIQFDNETDAETAYNYYASLSNIEFVEPDTIVENLEYNPDNSDFNTYDINNTMSDAAAIRTNLIQAKQYLLDNVGDFNDVYVAVIDSGINKEHEALKGRFVGGKNFVDTKNNLDGGYDSFGHGTNVAGVIVENTLPNVKLVSYKIYESRTASSVKLSLAIEQAIIDNIDVINISLGGEGSDVTLLNEAINKAYDQNITIVAGAGNDNINLNLNTEYPACYDKVITVGATDIIQVQKADYSNYGRVVKIYAPGVFNTTNIDGGYSVHIGTSFAAPCISAQCANIKTLYPNENNEYIRQRLLDGSVKMTTQEVESTYFIDMYNTLIIDEPEILYTANPTSSIVNNDDGTKTITLSCTDEDAVIYYKKCIKISNEVEYYYSTLGYNIYTEPIVCDDACDVVFFAQANTKKDSDVFCERIMFGHSENGFYCNDEGQIIYYRPDEYDGDPTNLVVPETIDDITVTGFDMWGIDTGIHSSGFFNKDVVSVVMPETISELPDDLFTYCQKLTTVIAPSVTKIGSYAFNSCSLLSNIQIGLLEKIGEYAFSDCVSLTEFPYLENIKEIPQYAFNASGIKEIYAPNCEIVGYSAFSNSDLEIVHLPNTQAIGSSAFSSTYNLKKVNIQSADSDLCGENLFWNSGIKSIEIYSKDIKNWFYKCNLDYIYLPNVERIVSSTFHELSGENSAYRVELENSDSVYLRYASTVNLISIPSTVSEIKMTRKVYDGVVYGTKSDSNYVYKWCTENNVEFKDISQKTALMNDVPMEITDLNTVLTADVIGFNRTYQWYANTKPENTTGEPIEGATSKTFSPSDYPQADYYYCVVTSTDANYEPVTIRTGVTKNNYVDEPVTEPTTESLTEPSTEPTKPTEPSAKPTKPTTESATESTTVQETKPTTDVNETKSKVGTTDNYTTDKQSQNQSTSSQNIKKNNSKISPATGENLQLLIPVLISICLCGIVIVLVVRKQKIA